MRRLNNLIKLLTASTILFIGCTPSVKNQLSTDYSAEDTKKEITELINKRMNELSITGLSVSVIADNKVLIDNGFGLAKVSDDSNKEIKADNQTLFQMGSISKIFTATAIMQLHETGKLDIDEPVIKYIPELEFKGSDFLVKDITIRHFLNHQSGIPSLRLKGFLIPEPSNDKFLELPEMLKTEYLTWAPETLTAYNNTALALLGIVITRASKMSYEDYITTNIFNKIGMDSSQTNLPLKSDAVMANGYMAGNPMKTLHTMDVPAGSFISSSSDMSNFLLSILSDYSSNNNRILSSKSLKSMFTIQNKDFKHDGDTKMGLTYFIDSINNELVVGHDGDLPPFHATMKMMPTRGHGIYLSSNDEVTSQMQLVLLGNEILELLYKRTTGLEITKPILSKPELEVLEDNSAFKQHKGVYTVANIGMVKISEIEGKLVVGLMGISGELIAYSNGSFTLQGLEFIRFTPNPEHGYIDVYFNNVFLGSALKNSKQTLTNDVNKYIGTYMPVDSADKLLVNNLKIEYDNQEQLIIVKLSSMLAQMEFPVSLKDNRLVGEGIGRSQGQSLYFEGDSLFYSSIEWNKVD